MILLRICTTFFLLLGVIIFPWYVQAVLLFLACFLFDQYYEGMLVAVVFGVIAGSVYVPLLFISGMLIAVEYIKTKLTFYNA